MGDLNKYLDEARNLVKGAGDVAKTAAVSHGIKEKVQDALQDGKAVKELRQGLSQLEALPEIEGSIIYRMELETTINYLNSLQLIISDSRMDKESAAEEIRNVMDKVQPVVDPQEAESEEEQAIENVKAIAYSVCTRALEALSL